MNLKCFCRNSIYIVFLFTFYGTVLLPKQGIAQSENLDEQIRIEILESRVKHFYGVEKLDALIDLANFFEKSNGRKSTRYARQALLLAEEIFLDENQSYKQDTGYFLPKSYIRLGRSYYFNSKYVDAKEVFEKVDQFCQEIAFLAGIEESTLFLDKIDSMASSGQDVERGFLSQSLKSLKLKEKMSKTSLDWQINQKINAAESHVKKYEYDEAIIDFEEAINLLKNKGDQGETANIQARITEIQRLQNINEEVISNYNDAIAEQEKIIRNLQGDTISSDSVLDYEPEMQVVLPNLESNQIEKLELKSDSLKALADVFLKNEDFEKAEEYRLLSLQVENEIKKRENAETQLELLRQQKQLAESTLRNRSLQLASQKKEKQTFIIGIGMLLALAIALLTLYFNKQRDLKKLSIAYHTLEEIKAKLTDAEINIRKLLRQQVSEDIAIELMKGGASLSTKKSFVCILFLDIRDFTPWAEKHTPEEIIEYQNKVFGFMMDIVNEFSGNINQLLGDGFMATFGAPKSGGNDCQNAFDAARKIIKKINEDSNDVEIENTKIGIGLHAGFVVTGNVGTELRKQYSITGNTVILASRLEQLNKRFNSQLIISREVYDQLEVFNGEASFKEVQLKGREKPVEILTVT